MARRHFRRPRQRLTSRGNHWLGDVDQLGPSLTGSNPDAAIISPTLVAQDVQPQGVQAIEADSMTLMAIRGSLNVRWNATFLDPSRGIGVRFSWGLYLSALNDDTTPVVDDNGLTTVDWLYINTWRATVTDEYEPDYITAYDLHVDIHVKARRKLRAQDTIFTYISAVATSALGGGEQVDSAFEHQLRFLLRI